MCRCNYAKVYNARGLHLAEKQSELFHCLWRKVFVLHARHKNTPILHFAKRQKCRRQYIQFHDRVITMTWESAKNTNQHLKSRTMNHPSGWIWKLLTNSLVGKHCFQSSDEVTVIIAKASVTFGRLRANGIKFDTELKVYKAVPLPTLLYVCGTLTVYQRHKKRLSLYSLPYWKMQNISSWLHVAKSIGSPKTI